MEKLIQILCIVLILVLVTYLICRGRKQKRQYNEMMAKMPPVHESSKEDPIHPTVRLYNTPGDPAADKFACYLAGVNYRNSEKSHIEGSFFGYVIPEKDNPYNPEARAVYTHDGDMMGYIPETKLREYIRWSNGEPMACVILIERDGYNRRGDVIAIRFSNYEFFGQQVKDTIEWAKRTRGLFFSGDVNSVDVTASDTLDTDSTTSSPNP